MRAVHRFREEDEEITQKLDRALAELQDANARQHRARERLTSDRPPATSDEERDLDAALDAGSGPRHVVG